MKQNILDHYLEFSTYTDPGLYRANLEDDLPNDVGEIGALVRKNFIHPSTLAAGNVDTNADLKFGDMKQVPWWRQREDDISVTAAAMLAELYRRDSRGFVQDRNAQNKLVLSCRYVAIIMATILKSKGIPTRVRAGHANYFNMEKLGNVSSDHWINQYWSAEKKRWITIDVDGSWSLKDNFDPYDLPEGRFDFPGPAWLNIRTKKVDPNHFYNAGYGCGAIVVIWSLFYDFHCLMNNEIHYNHGPIYGDHKKFNHLTKQELVKIDHLAELMGEPDENFEGLKKIWETERSFRILTGGLL